MEENKHDPLEQVFISEFDSVQFDENPLAWEEMSALLDKSKKRRIGLWLFGMATVLVVLVLAIYPFSEIERTQNTAEANPPKNELTERSNVLVVDSATADDTENDEVGIPESTPSKIALLEGHKEMPYTADVSESTPDRTIRKAIPTALPYEKEDAKDSVPTQRKEAIEPESEALAIDTLQNIETKDTASKSSIDNIVRSIPTKYKGFGFGIATGLEASSSGLLSKYSLGYRTGVLGEYRFRNGFTLGSGAYISRKNYESTISEYSAPAGFWKNGIKPTAIKGSCTMIEIPLEVGYTKGLAGMKSLYVGGGVASYLMLDEEYDYFYETNSPNLVQNWSTKNGPDYWLAVAQLRVGYTVPANRLGGDLQLSLYTHIPLESMGHGLVHIYSTGLEMRWRKR